MTRLSVFKLAGVMILIFGSGLFLFSDKALFKTPRAEGPGNLKLLAQVSIADSEEPIAAISAPPEESADARAPSALPASSVTQLPTVNPNQVNYSAGSSAPVSIMDVPNPVLTPSPGTQNPPPAVSSPVVENPAPPKLAPENPPSSPPPPPPPSPQTSPSNVNHVVVSEVQLTGGTGKTEEDFIELYNPTNQIVDLSGWKLKKRTKTGSEGPLGTFDSGLTIPARGFFLWANSKDGFADRIGADIARSYSVAANNSIALLDVADTVIDAVAWGSDLVNPFVEGSSLTAALEANQSYERKAWNGGCVSAQDVGELLGNGCDTGNNGNDFSVRPVSSPQRSNGSPEPQN